MEWPSDSYAIRVQRLHAQPVYHLEGDEALLTPERRAILNRIPPSSRVLEVGAGRGIFSGLLRDRGHDVVPVEGDPRSAEHGRSSGFAVVEGDAESDEVWGRVGSEYDVILFMHLLEHLVDPWHTLGRARERLRPGGRVLSLVPNVASWRIRKELFLHGQFEYQDTGILDRTHLRFFTLGSALDLHCRAGFTDIEWQPTDVCVPFERRLREQLRSPRLAAIVAHAALRRFPNLCTEIVLIEARA